MMFKHFDVDDSGFISRENIAKVMTKNSKPLSDEEIEKALKAHDITNDGQLSYEEFRVMMTGTDAGHQEFDKSKSDIDSEPEEFKEQKDEKKESEEEKKETIVEEVNKEEHTSTHRFE